MNMKNTICFIILLFLLIGAVEATGSDNETLQQTTEQPDDDICHLSVDNDCTLTASKDSDKLEASINAPEKLEAGKKAAESIKTPKSSKTKTSIKASDLKLYYKDSATFTVTLKDSSKKAIKNEKIKVNVFGKSYSAKTDSKGKASFKINGADCGTFKAEVKYDGSKKYYGSSAKCTITIKSTIKSSGMTKYYTNAAAHYATFYDKKGKVLKNTAVKFVLNGKSHSIKTSKKGVAKLSIDLKPGNYVVSQTNPKTSQTTTNIIQIKTILETKDLTMTENDGSKFSVKVLNGNGKAATGKKVTLKANGKTYTPKSNSQGIASQVIDLSAGKYTITTEYDGLVHTNQLTVNKGVTHTPFSHVTSIPTYVNVTTPYVFSNSAYVLKSGPDGIIKMPKNDVFTVQISETQGYLFSSSTLQGVDSIVIGYKTHLVPFDGSPVKSDYSRDNVKGDGILISKSDDYIQIEYRSTTDDNVELFGMYMDKGFQGSETITYLQNYQIKAMVNFYTNNYDELGLKYNLGKLYGKTIYDFNYKSYDEVTGGNADKIKFVNTGEPVTYSYYGKNIVGYLSSENIMTKLIVDGVEEFEKSETISYGLSDKYRTTTGFEVLQGYAIINERITSAILEKWTNLNAGYLTRTAIRNVYGMFMASLETAFIADEIADQYAKDFNVKWSREKTTTILGGINLEDTYMHILNADMGMRVSGNKDNSDMFRLMNSLLLPNIEEYVLEPVAGRFLDNTTNSLDNVLSSATGNFSVAQLGELLYIFNNNDSAIILNTTSGVCNVVLNHGNNVYKGSQISTCNDCCSVGMIPLDILNGVRNLLKMASPGIYLLSDHFKKIHPLTTMAYNVAKFLLGSSLTGAAAAANGLLTTMIFIQATGTTYREKMIDEKSWHSVMDKVTFTRPGYLQAKKIYNIPNKNGGTDYIEVKINDDLSLDRTSAKYISEGKTKELTKQETYQYFCEDYWTPFSMPVKYWDESWKSK